MSEARKHRRRVRPGYLGLVAAGAISGALLFALTVAMRSAPLGSDPVVALSDVAALAAWGALFGGVAAIVGLAGVARWESTFGRGLFATLASGLAMTVSVYVFGTIPWPDIGLGLVVLPVLIGTGFTVCMGFVCVVASSTFRPGTT